MQFGVITGNPPFKKNLHLKIIDTIIPYIDNGAGYFIHPARWFEDPLAEYKQGSDRVRFRTLIDRLDDVKIMDQKTINEQFGIAFNGELMISKVKSAPSRKDIRIQSDIAQRCIDVILSYVRKQNLAMYADKDMIDGWRVQVKECVPFDPHSKSTTEYSRKSQCNLFAKNKVNVFHNGYADGVEWMRTRNQTMCKKASGAPIPYSIKFRTKAEAINFEKSCNANFYNNIIYLLKLDMHNPLKFLPWMEDYSHPWTDADYCRFFGKIGMDRECQKWMCRDVYDYRVKDYIKEEYKLFVS